MNHKLRQSIRRVGCIVAVSGFLCVLCLRIAHNIKSFLISSFWCNSMRSTWNQIAWRSACIRNLSLVFIFCGLIFFAEFGTFLLWTSLFILACSRQLAAHTHTTSIRRSFLFLIYYRTLWTWFVIGNWFVKHRWSVCAVRTVRMINKYMFVLTMSGRVTKFIYIDGHSTLVWNADIQQQ